MLLFPLTLFQCASSSPLCSCFIHQAWRKPKKVLDRPTGKSSLLLPKTPPPPPRPGRDRAARYSHSAQHWPGTTRSLAPVSTGLDRQGQPWGLHTWRFVFPTCSVALPSEAEVSEPSGRGRFCWPSSQCPFLPFGKHHAIADRHCRLVPPKSSETDGSHASITLAPELCCSRGWKSISRFPVPGSESRPATFPTGRITGCRDQSPQRCFDNRPPTWTRPECEHERPTLFQFLGRNLSPNI